MRNNVMILIDPPPAPPSSDETGDFTAVVDLACALARQQGGAVRVLAVLEAPTPGAVSEYAGPAQALRQRIAADNRAAAARLRMDQSLDPAPAGPDALPDIQPVVRVAVAGTYWAEVTAALQEHQVALLLVRGTPPHSERDVPTLLQQSLPADTAVFYPGGPAPQAAHRGRARTRVLVPARGGPHAALALRLAGALIGERQATLTLLHVLRPDLPAATLEAEERPFQQLLEQEGLAPTAQRVWAVGPTIADTIRPYLPDQDLAILGAPVPPPGTALTLGPVAGPLLRQAHPPILLVKTATPAHAAIAAQRQVTGQGVSLAPEALSLLVDQWFAENTFQAEEYQDLEQLVVLKRRQGVTISLGLPTLNEEATIGAIIRTLKTALMDEVPLLDEIVVIDSDSTDRTRDIAHSLGVPVAIHQQILPEAGPALRGKGEALWKSLHVLKGDLIAWVDTDVTNMDARFIYGLIGPLLSNPGLQYVKGYYHRPLQVGDTLQHEGGGRVTELTVRPLLNLFFPLLSGLVQPLAGEYAGRRSALERLPFFSGYGVETGLLIDLLEEYGLWTIGQVNLGTRVHRNQSLANLSLMAFSLIQVILSRLEEQARVTLIQDLNRSMKRIRFSAEHLALEVQAVQDTERPPIHTIPAYRRARAGRHRRPLARPAGPARPASARSLVNPC